MDVLALATLMTGSSGCGDVVVGAFESSESASSGSATDSTESETGEPEVMGRFVVVGPLARRSVSDDLGLTWTPDIADGTDDASNLNAVAWGEGLYVAGGSLFNARIYASSDGLEWDMVFETGGAGIYDVTYTGERFVAVGGGSNVFSSDDGLNWEVDTLPIVGGGLWAIGNDGQGEVLAVGNGDVVASADHGRTWNYKFDDMRSHAGVAFGDRFVVIDETGEVHLPFVGNGDWEISVQPTNVLHDIVYAEGRYWAAGELEVISSADGISWESHPIEESITSITWGAGVFMGVGGGDRMRSEDGMVWTRVVSDPLSQLEGVGWGDPGL